MEEILCNHDNYGGLYLDMTFNEKKARILGMGEGNYL